MFDTNDPARKYARVLHVLFEWGNIYVPSDRECIVVQSFRTSANVTHLAAKSFAVAVAATIRWVSGGEDCVVIGLECFPMGLSMRNAGNTVYAPIYVRARRI
jgi:hypothetical protein